jgi:hypothetical protein
MTRRDTYTRFCTSAPDLPLFMQPWYLDAVCENGYWDSVSVEKGGRTVAVFPFFVKKKWRWQYVAMPLLGRFMGPYMLPEYRVPRREMPLLEALIEQLPAGLAGFEQDFNYTAQNWLPFYWHGYRQTTRYSYRLAIGDPNLVWQQMAPDYRNQKIPKAQEATTVQTGLSLIDFMEIHDRSYERKGMPPPVPEPLLTRLDKALAEHNRREIFFAADRRNGAIHSVAYLVWDDHSAYYLMAGDDPALRQSGAGILLVWEAIRYAHQVLKVPFFDFAGSMIRSVERVRRQFGAVQIPYFRVKKENAMLWKIGKMWRY